MTTMRALVGHPVRFGDPRAVIGATQAPQCMGNDKGWLTTSLALTEMAAAADAIRPEDVGSRRAVPGEVWITMPP
jgi:hypothetical protein